MYVFKKVNILKISRIDYRNDINGLRAIAVLGVVFYHADIEFFKGGWLGVDVFFVISGYLISNIIVSQINEGIFSFRNFYIRRIKRILPALFSTMLLTIPFAYFLLPPKAMGEFIDSMLASIFFFANYHFMNLDFYVAESTKFMPLLHTWSLAIEEQFYLLFPFFAFIIYKYFKKYFTLFIIFITIGSLYLNTLSESSDKFYRLEFRIWELLLGVVVMILSSNLKVKHLEKLGLPLLLFSFYFFGDAWINDIEPKLISLTATSLIIFSNTESTKLTKFFKLKFISTIGLISYSMYLIHQPLFSLFRRFSQYYDIELTNSVKFYLIILLLIFSYLNYQYVEKQAQNMENFKLVLSILFTCILIIVGFSIIFKTTDLIKSRFVDIPDFSNGTLNVDFAPEGQVVGTGSNIKFIIVGDSHTQHLLGYLSKKAEEDNFSFIQITHSACFSFINYTNYYNPDDLSPPPDRDSCYRVVNVLIDYLETYDLPVIFANTWVKTFSLQNSNTPIFYFEEDKSNWDNLIKILVDEILLIKNLTNSKSTWYIVGKNPGSYNYKDRGYLNCITKNKFIKNNLCELEGEIKDGTFYLGNELFDSILKNINEIEFINPYTLYCNNSKCYNFINNNLVYSDHHHFTYEGSKPLVDEIINRVLK
jgi:peptidoglycan/LPS O-acetylase OafA/YrhL